MTSANEKMIWPQREEAEGIVGFTIRPVPVFGKRLWWCTKRIYPQWGPSRKVWRVLVTRKRLQAVVEGRPW